MTKFIAIKNESVEVFELEGSYGDMKKKLEGQKIFSGLLEYVALRHSKKVV